MNNTNIFSTHIGPDVFQIHLNATIEVQLQECNRMLNARQIFDTDGCTHTDKFSKKHPVYDVPYYRKNGAADYFDCAVCASTIETIIAILLMFIIVLYAMPSSVPNVKVNHCTLSKQANDAERLRRNGSRSNER